MLLPARRHRGVGRGPWEPKSLVPWGRKRPKTTSGYEELNSTRLTYAALPPPNPLGPEARRDAKVEPCAPALFREKTVTWTVLRTNEPGKDCAYSDRALPEPCLLNAGRPQGAIQRGAFGADITEQQNMLSMSYRTLPGQLSMSYITFQASCLCPTALG